MGLEADDGRPETSPPLRGVVQTADRAVVRERQAIPGDQGRVRHRAIDPAALGPRHPDSGSTRGGATGGWRWRWTFQNKRRRYSHEGRRDTGQRRPLPDIGAMQDTGRSPLHLLLDDRASRDGACGLCFCKLVSTVWALLFSSVGGWFPTETAPSEPAALFFLAIWS